MDEFIEEEQKNTFVRDETDANFFTNILSQCFPQNVSPNDNYTIHEPETQEVDNHVIPTELDLTNLKYKFNHPRRGYAIIVNNTEFDIMKERRGSDLDASALFGIFRKLQFDVTIYTNFRAQEIHDLVGRYSEMDHSDADCFVCCVLSHGDQNILHGTDTYIQMEKLAEPFKKCKSLFGKPKLFIIQACRGAKLDPGVKVMPDGDQMSEEMNIIDTAMYRFPSEADFLWIYATSPGYKAWRRPLMGTCFIQALVKALDSFGTSDNLLHVLVYANYRCADFISSTLEEETNRKKQSSSYFSTLTKDIFL